jgi:uncharacterized protein
MTELPLAALDWPGIETAIRDRGYAQAPAALPGDACQGLAQLYGDDQLFRSRVDMARYRFGEGDYAYFADPLPPLVERLRRELYGHLAPIANRMASDLGQTTRYPADLGDYRRLCHAAGQTKPTPLLLRYRAGGYNCLHRDLYGDLVFPLQVVTMLSRPGIDYGGGEFLLVENQPRQQARGEAIQPAQGDMVIFPVYERPVPGARGWRRAQMRHGVSRVHWGERYTLGLIFHDAS